MFSTTQQHRQLFYTYKKYKTIKEVRWIFLSMLFLCHKIFCHEILPQTYIKNREMKTTIFDFFNFVLLV